MSTPSSTPTPEADVPLSWHARLTRHFPPGQFIRYLCVGCFNTVFGFTTFAAINYILRRHNVPVSYLYAVVLANLINITVAYFGYKIFVFKTQGNYRKEWLKAMAVYGTSFLPTLITLPTLVQFLKFILPLQLSALHHTYASKEAAPYIANAILTVFGVIYNFFGHKNVTFRQPST